jgi:hypothetical protein
MGYANLCVIFGLDAAPAPVPEIKRRMALFAREVMPAFDPGKAPAVAAAVTDLAAADGERAAQHVIDQLQADLGGEVVAIRRQARWRPAWFVDLRRDGQLQELYVRGARTDMRPIFPLEHERRMQELLGSMGIPVPQVHGYLRDPPAIVMDRVAGEHRIQRLE